MGTLTSHKILCELGLSDGASGLSSLAEKIRKSNRWTKVALSPQLFWKPCVLVRPGFEPATFRSADGR